MKYYRKLKRTIFLVLFALLILGTGISAQTGSQYGLSWWTVDGGGGTRSGGNYSLTGTTGQAEAGISKGETFTLVGGFWANASSNIPDPVDLVAQSLEVTQAIQDLNNSVRLIANKRTFVRFHVSSQDDPHRTYARIRVERSGRPSVWLNPINLGDGHINVRSNPNRGAVHDSFLFELPSGYTEGAVTLTAEVNPLTPWRDRNPIETNIANNTISTTVSFETVPPMNLMVYSVGYGTTNIIPAEFHLNQLAGWLESAYPVNTLNVKNRTYYHGVDLPNCGQVNAALAARRTQDLNDNPGSSNTRYYGMVDDAGGFMRGCAATIPSSVASGPTGTRTLGWDFDGSYGDWYGGHELGHTYGRFHAEFCGAGGGRPYPYPDGRISPDLAGDRAIFGFDIRDQNIYESNWTDVMTYCPSEWVSDFTYEGLMDFFRNNLGATATELRSQNQTDRLLIVGTIDPKTNQVELQPIFVVPNAGELKPRIPGDYAIVLRNSNGDELARYPFTPQEMEGGPVLQNIPSYDRQVSILLIDEFVPYVTGTDRVEIEGPGGILTSVSAGPLNPTITLSTPNGGETLAGDTITVAWTASDPDGDPLTFNVQYSPDNGVSWEVVAQNISYDSVELDASNIVSSQEGIFRVWATDGINTASDQSNAPFIVPNRLPTAQIIEPADNITAVISETVAFEGIAYDVGTGTMEDSQVQWISNIDGALGNGARLSTANLNVGNHVITLQADDGAGGIATDSVEVTVVSDPTQLPATPDKLVVGPSSIVFNPATSVTSNSLSIDNQNTANSITWNASSSEPWIQLSTASGTTPDNSEITINDSVEITNNNNVATITFSSPEVPNNSTTVSVYVMIDSNEPEPLQDNRIYIPIITK